MSLTIGVIFAQLLFHCLACAFPLNLALEDFSEEIHKIPTRQEYLHFLEGELSSLSSFAPAMGEAYQEQFKEVIKNFDLYKATPDLVHAGNLEKAIVSLNASSAKEISSMNAFMILSLQNLRIALSQEISMMNPQSIEHLKGVEWVLFSFSGSFGYRFDNSFDEFDSTFDDFILTPNEEKRQNLLKTLKQLEMQLTDG